jgi:hypothetical protein
MEILAGMLLKKRNCSGELQLENQWSMMCINFILSKGKMGYSIDGVEQTVRESAFEERAMKNM